MPLHESVEQTEMDLNMGLDALPCFKLIAQNDSAENEGDTRPVVTRF